jgi:hypothetical protein
MSKGSRIAIGSVALLFTPVVGLMVYITWQVEPLGEVVPYLLLELFCVAIALACLVPGTQPVTVRIVAGLIFLLVAATLTEKIRKAWAGEDHDLGRFLVGGAIIGLPALYMTIFGVYPTWGRHSSVFRNEREDR